MTSSEGVTRRSRRRAVAAGLLGAVVVAALAGLVVATALGQGLASVPSPSPVAARTPAQTDRPTPSAEPSVPSAAPNLTHAPSVDGVYSGCFFSGSDLPRTQEEEPVVAPELLAKLPEVIDGEPVQIPGYPSTRGAWIGSSLTAGIGGTAVQGFASCTGADPATIRFGWARGPNSLGYDLMAVEVDGFSGPELADLFLSVTAPADYLATLRSDAYHRWSYRTDGQSFLVTSSRETIYWIKWFCCVDPPWTEGQPTFDEIVHRYLDAINDDPSG